MESDVVLVTERWPSRKYGLECRKKFGVGYQSIVTKAESLFRLNEVKTKPTALITTG